MFLCKPTERQILLAIKKRKFGEGKWNGVGGKLEEGETVARAAVREAREEVLVDIEESSLTQVATIEFVYEGNPEWDQEVHIFFTEKWEGEPSESEEMRPEWYSMDNLPFDRMWADDPHWLPRVLAGEKLKGSVTFNSTGTDILRMSLGAQ